MKIKIWSDFVCPFCYIGGKHLEDALKELDDAIEIEYMSYELDPRSNPEKDLSMIELLQRKYGMSEEAARQNVDRIDTMAHQAGLEFNGGIAIQANTFKAHKVFQYAKTVGLGTEVFNRFYELHFVEGRDINDEATLIEAAVNLGLDEAAIKQALAFDDYAMHVRNEENWAANNGVKGVPFFLIDDQVSLSGAQPISVFKDAINHVKTLNFSKADSGLMCNEDGCVI